ncbi:hypothetical protein AZE42_11494 [Rhizopogon vesiculosus]|uniref:Heterokaryon incompatibility domain-containing protein n=1 Tax=Rhizopogon vesiculosus TaxID=180088 RepID=A0A1J8Q6W4_9AGAM|nr:hypothetical protein AZE42_11494 [Rhizopogon vesiculosus]
MERALPLGQLTDILNKHDQCGLCRLIAITVRRSWNLDNKPDINITGITCALYAEWIAALDTEGYADLHIPSSILPVRRDLCHRLRIKTSSRPKEVTAALDATQSSQILEIQLLEEDASKVGRTRELHGRRVGQTVDIGILKRWIHICENEHREKCETMWWTDPGDILPKAMRVLDVVRMAIVQAPRSCRYVALSYLWGGTGEDYRTTQANLKQRSRSGGLDISVLPVTILDTIEVVRQLDERYLWIDALCIVQDDPKDKAKQIGAMDLVYGKSVFTIFAAGGTSVRDPLPGVRPGTRNPRQEIAKIQGLHLAVPLVHPSEARVSSEWNTRGWTYQELMLSRRRVFFTSHHMHFECVKDVFGEDIVAERVNFPWASHPLMFTGAGQVMRSGVRLRSQSGMRLRNQRGMRLRDSEYMVIVEEYTRRRLTFESDILNAITAFINVMTKAYRWASGEPSGAFRFGMPIGDLELALVWQPAANAFRERRVLADRNGRPFPSWSWAAWRGAVQYGSAYVAFVGENPGSPPDIRESLVEQWYIVDDDGKLARQEVWRSGRTGDAAHWTIYVAPKGDIDIRQLTSKNALLRPGTLVFRTSSAHFNVAKADDSIADADANYAIYSILSDIPQPSTWVGRVLLPSSTHSPTLCEFVVLSRTSGSAGWFDDGRFDEHKVLERVGYDGCMFYVMAVQNMQDEERMERLGVGVIFDRAWIKSTAEQKIVFLG